jgi:hypothetical protein
MPVLAQEVSNLIGMKVRPGALLSAQTDIGCQRVNNEDSFGYWEPEEDGEFLRKGRLANMKVARKRVAWRSSRLSRPTAILLATIRNRGW